MPGDWAVCSWVQLELRELIGRLVIAHGLLPEVLQLCGDHAAREPVSLTCSPQMLVLQLTRQQLDSHRCLTPIHL